MSRCRLDQDRFGVMERLSGCLSGCVTEKCVKTESDALRVLLAGVETRFREEHGACLCDQRAHGGDERADCSARGAVRRRDDGE